MADKGGKRGGQHPQAARMQTCPSALTSHPPAVNIAPRPRHPAATLARRRLLCWGSVLPLAALTGCAAPWPDVPAGPGSSSALARLNESAAAHGRAAWHGLADLSLGLHRDPGTLGGVRSIPGIASAEWQLRWLPKQRLLAWLDSGPPAPQQGRRHWAPAPNSAISASAQDSADLQLWQAGQAVSDLALLSAAAQQIDLLRLLLLGPVALVEGQQPVNWAEPATLDGRRCDQLTLDLAPGLGGVGVSRLALFVDRDEGLMRRLRVMSIAEQGRPGASAATWDLRDPLRLHGMQWPRLCQPSAPGSPAAALPPAWRLIGLDVNRGYRAADLDKAQLNGLATAPAAAL